MVRTLFVVVEGHDDTAAGQVCDAVDCFHDRRSDVRAEPRVLCGESISYAGLWHVGARQQVQQRLE